MASNAQYETFKKAVTDILSARGETELSVTIAEIAADIDRLDTAPPGTAAVAGVDEFKSMSLTQKGELFKSDPEKYNKLAAASKN